MNAIVKRFGLFTFTLPKFYWGTRKVEVVRERESQYEMTDGDLAWYNALSIAQTAAIGGAIVGLIAGVLSAAIH